MRDLGHEGGNLLLVHGCRTAGAKAGEGCSSLDESGVGVEVPVSACGVVLVQEELLELSLSEVTCTRYGCQEGSTLQLYPTGSRNVMVSLGVPGDVTQIGTCHRLEGENKPGQALPTILRSRFRIRYH